MPFFVMINTRLEYLKKKIATLPDLPGVYQYINAEGVIIYVGKAKNLKKRVASYFTKKHDSPKLNVLVRNINDFKYIIVGSEADALLLENNLIKKYLPRYNVLLKDGKTYPWLCITRDYYPRVFKTRQIYKGAEYFGPYSSNNTLEILLELIQRLYPIRTCRYPLTEDNVAKKKFKLCLQYHIHNCRGVCQGLQTHSDYLKMVNEIREIAKGNSHAITDYLLSEMKQLASEQRFEEAQVLKEKYDIIANYQAKTVITTTNDDNLDVFGYDEDDNSAYVNILRIVKGSVIQGLTIEYQKKMEETKEDILSLAIVELRERLESTSKEVILPFCLEFELPDVSVTIPQRGDKKKLLELSQQNVKQYKLDRLKQSEKLSADQRSMRVMKEIKDLLHLDNLPQHIECFDNSNISGFDAVAACVVYKKGRPSKKDYRKYNIKTVVGSDDYASMREVVHRRYTRMIQEGAALPDLIITDGGKGQMEVVRSVIEDELHQRIPIVGLVKDGRHKTSELLFGFPAKQIGLKQSTAIFKFLASIQDEVHRFAITFHRNQRSKTQIASELDNIRGIGEKLKIDLIKHFKSIKRIQNAEKEELEKIIGTKRASIVYDHFRSK